MIGLLREAHTDLGRAAECLRVALTTPPSDLDDDAEVESVVGFALLAEGLVHLRNIQTLLTPPKAK